MVRPVRPVRHPRGLAAVLLAASLAVGAVACSSDGEDEPSGPTVAPSIIDTQTTTRSPDDTIDTDDPTATTTTTAVPPVGAPEGPQAAMALYDAWVADDRVAAALVAEPEAIDAIWAAVPGPYELYRGCDTGEFDTGGCLFRDRSTNHTIQIDLTRRDGMWVVTGAFFSES